MDFPNISDLNNISDIELINLYRYCKYYRSIEYPHLQFYANAFAGALFYRVQMNINTLEVIKKDFELYSENIVSNTSHPKNYIQNYNKEKLIDLKGEPNGIEKYLVKEIDNPEILNSTFCTIRYKKYNSEFTYYPSITLPSYGIVKSNLINYICEFEKIGTDYVHTDTIESVKRNNYTSTINLYFAMKSIIFQSLRVVKSSRLPG